MNQGAIQSQGVHRASLVQRGRRLEYFSVAYNSLEGLIAIVAGLLQIRWRVEGQFVYFGCFPYDARDQQALIDVT